MNPIQITAKYLRPFVHARGRNGHKGDYGKILIIAGSKGMTGAAVLAARSVLKSGAGLVTIACPDSEQPIMACSLAEAMTLPLPSKSGVVLSRAAGVVLAFQKAKKYDVCLIGPGLSVKGGSCGFVGSFLRSTDMPAVVDADALNALSLGGGLKSLKAGPARIFTPHYGEALRFFSAANAAKTPSPADRRALVLKLQSRLGGICLLKGPGTLVTDGRRLLGNTSGGPALAKGGSGDVLAGLIAGLWAQSGRRSGFTPATALQSAALGVYVHGLAGDLAAEKMSERCVLAGEIIQFLPAAFRRIRDI